MYFVLFTGFGLLNVWLAMDSGVNVGSKIGPFSQILATDVIEKISVPHSKDSPREHATCVEIGTYQSQHFEDHSVALVRYEQLFFAEFSIGDCWEGKKQRDMNLESNQPLIELVGWAISRGTSPLLAQMLNTSAGLVVAVVTEFVLNGGRRFGRTLIQCSDQRKIKLGSFREGPFLIFNQMRIDENVTITNAPKRRSINGILIGRYRRNDKSTFSKVTSFILNELWPLESAPMMHKN